MTTAQVIPITAAWFSLFWTLHLSDGWWRLFTSTVLLKCLLMELALSQTIYSNVIFTTTNGFEDDTGGRRTANSTLIRFGSDASGCPMTATWVALKAELFRILGQNCFEIDSFLWRCNIIMVKSALNSCSNLSYVQNNRLLRPTSAMDFLLYVFVCALLSNYNKMTFNCSTYTLKLQSMPAPSVFRLSCSHFLNFWT